MSDDAKDTSLEEALRAADFRGHAECEHGPQWIGFFPGLGNAATLDGEFSTGDLEKIAAALRAAGNVSGPKSGKS